MGIRDITDPGAVRKAIEEFDQIGRESFLAKYGFGKAETYYLQYDGKEYDSKAILGAAHGYAFPNKGALSSNGFSGGIPALTVLENLGFEVAASGPVQPSDKLPPPHLFLVPASNPPARANMARSVTSPVPKELYEAHLDEAFVLASLASPDDDLYLWGCFAGGQRENLWNRMVPGDYVILVQSRRYRVVARVGAKTRSPELSHALWVEEDGKPFELIYSLVDPDEVDVSIDDLNEWLPKGIRGFMRLSEEKQERIISQFGSLTAFVDQRVLGIDGQPEDSPTPTYWWVNQGISYARARDGGYLSAPKADRGGRTRYYHTNVSKLRPGDVVFHYADRVIKAIGTVTEEPFEGPRPDQREGEPDDDHIALIKYDELPQPFPGKEIPAAWRTPESGPFDKTGTTLTGYLYECSPDFGRELLKMITPQEKADPLQPLADRVLMSASEVQNLIDLLRVKGQLILQGPPGCGKTWVAEALARHLTDNELDSDQTNPRFEMVQFHQSFGYEDFIQGIRPVTVKHELEYHVLPGILMRFIGQENWDDDLDYVLVIDEINRGNISKIFGELLLLLEYRDKSIRLPYAEATAPKFKLPRNLMIIGTMNTADRSLASIDYALRRRFLFHRLTPVEESKAPVLERWLIREGVGEPTRSEVLKLFVALNEHLGTLMGLASEDFQIGHSYFMDDDILDGQGRARIWRAAINPLLEEYFLNRKDRPKLLKGLQPQALLSAAKPKDEASADSEEAEKENEEENEEEVATDSGE